MRQILTVISILLLLFFIPSAIRSQSWVEQMMTPDSKLSEIQQSFNSFYEGKNYEKGKGWKQFKRWEYFMENRVDADGRFSNATATYFAARKLQQEMLSDSLVHANWVHLGPVNVPTNGGGAGRLNCIEFHPVNYNHMFVGAPAGGLWRTWSGGNQWFTNTDWLASIGVSDIVISQLNPNIMYLATGDGDAGDTYSVGVLKSIDGGFTWDTTGMNWLISQQRKIFKLLLNPLNDSIIYAATSAGLWRSTNAGIKWTSLKSGLFYDIEFKPGNPNVIYAVTSSSFLKSTDGGNTFTTQNILGTVTTTIRLAMAVTPADPEYIYILAGNNTDYGYAGLLRSTNSGQSWVLQSNTPNILGWATDGKDKGGQAWYDLSLAVSPTNKNLVFVGGVNIWKSANGGISWAQAAHWTGAGGNPYVHADIHALEFSPGYDNRLYACTDGGLFVTSDLGSSWNDLSNGLAIGQLYKISNSFGNSSRVISGWQDNGTNLLDNGSWKRIRGGDGMECIIDPTNPDIMYSSLYYGNINRSTNAGGKWTNITDAIKEKGAWVTPYLMHPSNPNLLYVGLKNVWKTTDAGANWTKISDFGFTNLNCLAVAPSNTNIIYASSANNLMKTTNGGTSWTLISSLQSSGNITEIVIHPTNPSIVWVTRAGYIAGRKVYQTTNGGNTWQNISGSLPNLPVNCLAFENLDKGGIYVGTDIGVYYRDSSMTDWVPFSDLLPNVIVNELEIHYPTHKIRAATYGRGLWQSDLYAWLASNVSEQKPATNALYLSPNPCSDEVLITLPSPTDKEVIFRLINAEGKIIYHGNIPKGTISFPFSVATYPQGTYLLNVYEGKNVSSNKLIIKR